MSVLIKGIEMPETCEDCQFHCYHSHGEYVCVATPMFYPMNLANSKGIRKDWCPLVALPEKHGRLIDADELWKKMSKYTDNMGAKMPFGDDDSMIHRDSACFMIESADTIIEAEGAEE